MNCKWFISILLFAFAASHHSFAQQTTIREPSEPTFVSDSETTYTELISVRDTIALGDSVVVIHTVCAPICSSHVRVYNKEWPEIGVMKAPFKSTFPEAYIEDDRILWRDNDDFDYEPAP